MQSETRLKKGEKPRIYTFSTDGKCALWRLKWAAAGFEPVVLPRDVGFRSGGVINEGETSLLQLLGSQKLIDAHRPSIDRYLNRIKARPNAPVHLDGYYRWIWTAYFARDTQYVFMVHPDIFPGDYTKTPLLTEPMCRYATAEKLILLAGSDAVMGTKTSFIRMCDLLVADSGVTEENCTDAFIVRRVQQQMIDFIIDLPSCKDHGEDGWEAAPLIRGAIGSGNAAPDLQTAITEMVK